MQETWLVFLEREINGIKVAEETMFFNAAKEEGAVALSEEYFVEEGWEVVGIVSA